MSVVPKPSELFAAYYGALVTGGAKALPATASGDIFSVSGGRVIITSLTGVVATALGATATTLSIGNKPTGGASATTTLCAAGTITSLAAGVSLAVPAAKASLLIIGAADGTLVWNGSSGAQGIPFANGGLALVPAGTIQVTTNATNTGTITWSCTWLPYDAGAVVAAL